MSKKLSVEFLYEQLVASRIYFFAGVPDSTLGGLSQHLDTVAKDSHVITPNEGSAIALAVGRYAATGEAALVYMQNSGLGNAVNPLASLADQQVMSVPIVLLIGWRGKPGMKDEPQHMRQGAATPNLLDALGIPYDELSAKSEVAARQVQKMTQLAISTQAPVALLIAPGTFDAPAKSRVNQTTHLLSRERAVKVIADSAVGQHIVVATTGMTSRELYAHREERQQDHNKDLLIVGSMGHSSAVALGVAMQKTEMTVYVIDGDGAALMHMGTLAMIGTKKPRNLCHIVINNGTYDSVGGQPTVARAIDLCGVARACGYETCLRITEEKQLVKAIKATASHTGLTFIEVMVNSDTRKSVGRPTIGPADNLRAVMRSIQESQ